MALGGSSLALGGGGYALGGGSLAYGGGGYAVGGPVLSGPAYSTAVLPPPSVTKIINQAVPVPVGVPQPYPVHVPKPVAVPVDRPVAVPVPQPYPVTVTKYVSKNFPQYECRINRWILFQEYCCSSPTALPGATSIPSASVRPSCRIGLSSFSSTTFELRHCHISYRWIIPWFRTWFRLRWLELW